MAPRDPVLMSWGCTGISVSCRNASRGRFQPEIGRMGGEVGEGTSNVWSGRVPRHEGGVAEMQVGKIATSERAMPMPSESATVRLSTRQPVEVVEVVEDVVIGEVSAVPPLLQRIVLLRVVGG